MTTATATTTYYITVPFTAHTTFTVEREAGLTPEALIDSIKYQDLAYVEGPEFEAVLEMTLDTLENQPSEVTVESD